MTQLPDDVAALRALVLAHRAEIEARDRKLQVRDQRIAALEIEKLRLEQQLLRLKKWQYGPRADQLGTAAELGQLLLAFTRELEARPLPPSAEPPAGEEPAAARRVRRGRGRRNLAAFEDLPATQVVHDLTAEERRCPGCGGERERIGEESSWQIEFIPARFERIEHVCVKYACRHCGEAGENPRIERAAKPRAPIERGLAGPGLLAYVATSKFADYLPLYRLEAIFERHGFSIGRATQGIWLADMADLARPVHERMKRQVMDSHLIATDDAVMPMLAPGKTRAARMWVYRGDDAHPYNLFDFTLSRARDGPARFLAGYGQVLLADAYGGYNGVVAGNAITRAGCWAHARRKFVEAEAAAPAIARAAVGLIAGLYRIEDRARGLPPSERLALRQGESLPRLAQLRERLLGWKGQLLPKHPMAEAIGYALGHWAELNAFAADPAIPIDNNAAEREMKRIVLNRKNSLFVGNPRGGQTAAILSSLTSTCRRHGADPQRYLTQLLITLPALPISQLDDWLPDRWQARQSRPPD